MSDRTQTIRLKLTVLRLLQILNYTLLQTDTTRQTRTPTRAHLRHQARHEPTIGHEFHGAHNVTLDVAQLHELAPLVMDALAGGLYLGVELADLMGEALHIFARSDQIFYKKTETKSIPTLYREN